MSTWHNIIRPRHPIKSSWRKEKFPVRHKLGPLSSCESPPHSLSYSDSGVVVGNQMASISAIEGFLPNSLAISLGKASKSVGCFSCICFSKPYYVKILLLKKFAVSVVKLIRFVFILQRWHMKIPRSNSGSSQELPRFSYSIGEWNVSIEIGTVSEFVDFHFFFKNRTGLNWVFSCFAGIFL